MWSSLRRLAPALLLFSSIASAATARPVADLKFNDLAGNTQRLSSLHGSISVVTFWATWCTPCQDELPQLVDLEKEYADKGVRFVAISVDAPKNRAKIQPFLEKNHITLNVWVGASGETLDRLHLGDMVPATIVLDKDGEPAGRIKGEAHPEDIGIYLDWLLDNRKGVAPQAVIKRY